jgi:hypothetical protein
MCFNLLLLCSISCFVRFTFYFVCSVFLYFLCIVSPPHVYSCLFFICVQFYRLLPPGGNPTAVNKYHNYGLEWKGHVVRVKAEGTKILLENLKGYLTLTGA